MKKGNGLLLFLCIVAIVAALLACVGFFFSAKEYTVTFDSNGGSFVAGCVVGEGKTAPRPVNPIREGYTFRGWYYDRGLSSEYSFNAPVNGDMTLYAGWKEYIDVSASVVAETKKAPEHVAVKEAEPVRSSRVIPETVTVEPEPQPVKEVKHAQVTEPVRQTPAVQASEPVKLETEVYINEPEVKPEVKPEPKPEVKPEVKPETKPEVKAEPKPEPKPMVKPVVVKKEPEIVEPEIVPEHKIIVQPAAQIRVDDYIGDPIFDEFPIEVAPTETVILNSLHADMSGTNSIAAKYNSPMPEIILPSKSGYIFGGYWTDPNGAGLQYYRADGSSARDYEGSDMTLYAKWIARDDTAYRIYHYLEGSEGRFILKDAENLIGVTDAVVSATPRTYAGYIYDSSLRGTLTNANIAADGSLVLRLFYRKDLLTVSFDSSGGSKVADLTGIEYDSNILPPRTPVRTGYRFAGWFTDNQVSKRWDFENNTVRTNLTLYAGWYANKDTAYKVGHYLEGLDGKYALKETVNLTGTTGAEAVSSPKEYKGFVFTPEVTDTVERGIINGDGSLLLKLYYKRQTFTVDFNTNGGSAIAPLNDVKFNARVAEPVAPKNAGYSFAGWYKDSNLKEAWNFNKDVVTDSTTLYARWTVGAGTGYKVFHYLETLDGKFALKEVENLKGTTESVVKAVAKSYQGFRCDSSLGSDSGAIIGDGSLTLKMFYRRLSFTLSFDSVGGSEVTPQSSLKYGTLTVAPENPVKYEYAFMGWYKDAEYESAWDFSKDTVVGDTLLYAKWQPNSYTIRLDKNGGPEDGVATVYYEDTTAEIGSVVPLTGYSLAGFYTAPVGGVRVLNANGSFASDNIEGYIKDGKWCRPEDCKLYIHWFDGKPVGGRIFYVGKDNGATYEFYDVDGEKITGKQDVVGLVNAVYYRIVSGTPKADKFYVYDITNGLIENIQWGSYKNNRNESVSLGVTGREIGQGKVNTAHALSMKEEDKIGGQSRKSLAFKDSNGGYETIWAYVSYMNGENGITSDSRELSDEFGFSGNRRVRRIAGCRDWYIGSPEEYERLRASTLEPAWFEDVKMVWSSAEVNYNDAYSWLYIDPTESFWSNSSKGSYCRAVLLRSF
ncbi:MAG: InlB B-repeat-containing protein [Sphaerochaetaceae bacterium]|nr:InlB B-repeat-containing protein [Sphaerochaetaceae bacterium]